MPAYPRAEKPQPEDGGSELPEVVDAGLRVALVVKFVFADAAGQTALTFRVVAVQDHPRLDQRGRRDHEAVRLDEAQPFEMGAGVGIGAGILLSPRVRPEIDQPIGSTRFARTS